MILAFKVSASCVCLGVDRANGRPFGPTKTLPDRWPSDFALRSDFAGRGTCFLTLTIFIIAPWLGAISLFRNALEVRREGLNNHLIASGELKEISWVKTPYPQ